MEAENLSEFDLLNDAELAQQALALRDQAADLERRKVELNERKKEIEAELARRMASRGQVRQGVAGANIALSTKRRFNTVDWDKVYQFILERGTPYMLQKRLTAAAVEEVFDTEGEMPGVEVFEETVVSIRRAN